MKCIFHSIVLNQSPVHFTWWKYHTSWMKPETIKSKNNGNIKKFTQRKQIHAQRPQQVH